MQEESIRVSTQISTRIVESDLFLHLDIFAEDEKLPFQIWLKDCLHRRLERLYSFAFIATANKAPELAPIRIQNFNY